MSWLATGHLMDFACLNKALYMLILGYLPRKMEKQPFLFRDMRIRLSRLTLR